MRWKTRELNQRAGNALMIEPCPRLVAVAARGAGKHQAWNAIGELASKRSANSAKACDSHSGAIQPNLRGKTRIDQRHYGIVQYVPGGAQMSVFRILASFFVA